jgi:predicted ATPase
MEIQGLAFPPSETEIEIDHYSAIQLFLQTARRVNVGFAFTDSQKSRSYGFRTVADAVRIELAAAWVRVLSCDSFGAKLSVA